MTQQQRLIRVPEIADQRREVIGEEEKQSVHQFFQLYTKRYRHFKELYKSRYPGHHVTFSRNAKVSEPNPTILEGIVFK